MKRALQRWIRRLGYRIARAHPGDDLDWLEMVARNDDSRSFRTIFDVGANEGQTLDSLILRFPGARIHSFEPIPEMFAALQAKATAAKLAHPPQAHPFALGETPGRSILHVNAASYTSSLLPNAAEAEKWADSALIAPKQDIEIKISTLDIFCRENGIEGIDLLKIDTQGFDLRVLRGGEGLLREKRVRWIVVEMACVPLYEGQGYFDEIYRFLVDHGFVLHGVDSVNRDERGRLVWLDGIFRLRP